jgi:hypothetical protein
LAIDGKSFRSTLEPYGRHQQKSFFNNFRVLSRQQISFASGKNREQA